MEEDVREKIRAFVVEENALFVMASFRKFGVLTGEDVRKAFAMRRAAWIEFMLEKAGVADRNGPIHFPAGDEVE